MTTKTAKKTTAKKTTAKPQKATGKAAEEKMLADWVGTLSPRMQHILAHDRPALPESPRLNAALKMLGEELFRLLPEYERDGKFSVSVYPVTDTGEDFGLSVRIIDVPKPKLRDDPETAARFEAHELQRRAVVRELFACRDAREGVSQLFGGNDIVDECISKGSYQDAREIVAGQLLVLEGLDALRTMLDVEPGSLSWERD